MTISRLPGSIFDSKIEMGYREVTDVEAKAIAEALGVTVAWLFGEGEKNRTVVH
jgi:hypothetical protein